MTGSPSPRDGLGRFGVIVATLIVGIVAVVALQAAWLALVGGAIVVGLVAADVVLHGDPELAPDEPVQRLTIDLDHRPRPPEINEDRRR